MNVAIMRASIAALLLAAPCRAAELRVKPGGTIQDSVNRARPGDTILVEPGEYRQSVYIDRPGLTLRGLRRGELRAVLDGGKKLSDGIITSGHSTVIDGFLVRGYKGNGIMTQGANNFKIINNTVEATFYGIFPQYGKNGYVAGNTVTGAEDAGIYVGMSDNIDVVRNTTFGNVIGIEFENCRNGLMADNTIYDNAGGITLSLMAGLPVKDAHDVIVRGNKVTGNNHVNFAPASSIAATNPSGSGIVVLGTKNVTIEDNDIHGNMSVGIAVSDLVAFGMVNDPKVDPYPDNVHVMRNRLVDNGTNPQGSFKDMLAASGTGNVQIVSTGKGGGSCLDPSMRDIVALGVKRWGSCSADMSKASFRTFMLGGGAEEPVYSAQQRGRLTFLAVCNGCHAYNTVLHGPTLQAIKALYADDPAAMLAFVKSPVHKRSDFPEMPPQAYLGDDTLRAVTNYILHEASN